jgi:hypothetical protein
MRWTPPMPIVVLMIVVWTAVLWAMRQRRKRMAAAPSPREMRSYWLHNVGVISATVGVTSFSVWLMAEAGGPEWLHAFSAPAALICIAVGAVIAGYAAWLGGP